MSEIIVFYLGECGCEENAYKNFYVPCNRCLINAAITLPLNTAIVVTIKLLFSLFKKTPKKNT